MPRQRKGGNELGAVRGLVLLVELAQNVRTATMVCVGTGYIEIHSNTLVTLLSALMISLVRLGIILTQSISGHSVIAASPCPSSSAFCLSPTLPLRRRGISVNLRLSARAPPQCLGRRPLPPAPLITSASARPPRPPAPATLSSPRPPEIVSSKSTASLPVGIVTHRLQMQPMSSRRVITTYPPVWPSCFAHAHLAV